MTDNIMFRTIVIGDRAICVRDRSIGIMVYTAAISLLLSIAVNAQNDDVRSRTITSEGFAKQRPVVTAGISVSRPTVKPNAPARKPATYKLARRNSSALRFKGASASTRPKPKPAGDLRFADIGVTIWKLRRPLSSTLGVKLPVDVGNGQIELWTAERTDMDSVFAAGDRVRFAVESPSNGFLYLVNAEVSDSGTLGTPRLIFPENAAQDNAVRPGMLVDVPDRSEPYPYFKLKPSRSGYAGELVAIIVSPVKLSVELGNNGEIMNIGDLVDLRSNVEFEIFNRTDNSDSLFTQAEADASCGAKTRDLVREDPRSQPCQNRELTRDQPLPQTIMRVTSRVGLPAVAFVRLNAVN